MAISGFALQVYADRIGIIDLLYTVFAGTRDLWDLEDYGDLKFIFLK